MIVGLIPPHAVRASRISDPVQAVRESTSWEPINSERIEVPSEAEKLTVDWLNRNYSITESSIMEQLGKGYSLTDIHQALKKDSNGKHLESGLDKINSQVKIQWDQIRDSINLTQIKDEPLRSNLKSKLSDEKLTELLKSSEKKLDSGVRKSESPERATEEIGADHSKEAFQSKGLTTMAAGARPYPGPRRRAPPRPERSRVKTGASRTGARAEPGSQQLRQVLQATSPSVRTTTSHQPSRCGFGCEVSCRPRRISPAASRLLFEDRYPRKRGSPPTSGIAAPAAMTERSGDGECAGAKRSAAAKWIADGDCHLPGGKVA